MKKKALITGIYGQDGSYLCELLLNKGYEVHGIVRKNLSNNSKRIKKLLENKGLLPKIHNVDLNDYDKLKELFLDIGPDEIYHVAAFHVSSEDIKGTKDLEEKQLFDYNVKSTSNILSICCDFMKNTKILTAGSCLMYDNSDTIQQDETTPFNSKSLYGLAKITENMLVRYYRNKGLYSCSAILYNHESSRRSSSFVTKKIVENMVKIKKGVIDSFTLGNINTKKDWGYAKDYAYGMYLMLQQNEARDYILSSGKLHTIKDFIEICSKKLDIYDWKKYIIIDSDIVNRKINTILKGNSKKAEFQIGFKHTLSFEQLVGKMLDDEIQQYED